MVEWSSWESLGASESTELRQVFVQSNQDGCLEVFANERGRLSQIQQKFPNAGWESHWRSQGEFSTDLRIQSHVVGRNLDGREEVFATASDGALWQKWQLSPNGAWSEWQSLGRPGGEVVLEARLATGANQDGRQEVFVVGADSNVWQIWQTAPNGGWSKWKSLGQPSVGISNGSRISVGRNADGRQELFVLGTEGAIWHIWQTAPNVGWTNWESLGAPRDLSFPQPEERDLFEPSVQENPDGHLEVFAAGNGAFCNRWQLKPNGPEWRTEGWNAKPKPEPNVRLLNLEAALDPRRQRVVAIGLGDDGALWHAWQIPSKPFWSSWESLGHPPTGLQRHEPLTIGNNQDGRLEAFAVGKDGKVWHVWQNS